MSEGRPDDAERVVVRDNRKIDPVTGEARKKSAPEPSEPAEPRPGAISSEEDVPKADALLLEERTRDLQRVQAEYANYRRRMEREVQAAEQRGVGRALAGLLPVLDDWDRAVEHGDVDGPIATILDKQQRALQSLGLELVGAEGDAFDPTVHEAVMHDESPDVTVPTATKILRKGYRHHDRLLRPAMVGVTDPETPTSSAATDATDAEADTGASGDEEAESNNAGTPAGNETDVVQPEEGPTATDGE